MPSSSTNAVTTASAAGSVCAVGVNRNGRPESRAASAIPAPYPSEPAIGSPPMYRTREGRRSSRTRTIAALVPVTSVRILPRFITAAASSAVWITASGGTAIRTKSASLTAVRSVPPVSIAPRVRATPTASGSVSTPTTCAAAPRWRRASPIEAPINPTPTMPTTGRRSVIDHTSSPGAPAAGRSSPALARPRRGLHGAAQRPGERVDLGHQRAELLRGQLLRPVAARAFGIGVDFNDQAVRSGGHPGPRHRPHVFALAGALAGIDDHRQVREFFQHGDGAQVQQVARVVIEAPDPAFAEHDAVVAFVHDVLSSEQQLLNRGTGPTLEQHGEFGAAGLAQQRVVLHVARADLDHVGVFADHLELGGVHGLGHHRQPDLLARLGEIAEAFLFQPLEGIGRGAGLKRAAPEHHRPGGLYRLRRGDDLLEALDRTGTRDDGDSTISKAHAADLDDRILGLELAADELKRLQDRDDPFHSRRGLQRLAEEVFGVTVPHHADDGAFHALGQVRPQPGLLDFLDNRLNALARRVGLHDDDHSFASAKDAHGTCSPSLVMPIPLACHATADLCTQKQNTPHPTEGREVSDSSRGATQLPAHACAGRRSSRNRITTRDSVSCGYGGVPAQPTSLSFGARLPSPFPCLRATAFSLTRGSLRGASTGTPLGHRPV